MTDPAGVVNSYFAAVRAGDADAVARLFTDYAVFVNAAGTLVGAEAIGRMYRNGLASEVMVPAPGPLLIDGDNVAVEIDLTVGDANVQLCDFFATRDGKIERLAIYSRAPTDGRLFDDIGVDPGT